MSSFISNTSAAVISAALIQSDWYVDPINGNDANPGTISFPIKKFVTSQNKDNK